MDRDTLALLIPIIAITMGCGIPLMAIYVDYRKRKDMFALYHQERMAAIEKGIELPPLPEEFFKEECGKRGKSKTAHADFGWGLFWLLGGLALLVALYFNEKGSSSLYALIPVAVGLHYLIYYYVVGKKEAAAIEAERKAKAAEIGRGSLT
jgi:hypothetical protein